MGAGPLIGGIAIEYVNWRYIFVAPLPLLMIAMILGNIVMPKSETSKKLSFDWLVYVSYYFVFVILPGCNLGWPTSRVDIKLHFNPIYCLTSYCCIIFIHTIKPTKQVIGFPAL